MVTYDSAKPDTRPGAVSNGRLAPRLRRVARLISEGCRNKEIAGRMGISTGTVKVYVSATMEALKLDSRLQVALWVLDGGLEKLPDDGK
jgi:DNA-binding NarL/FixJ family response regulator